MTQSSINDAKYFKLIRKKRKDRNNRYKRLKNGGKIISVKKNSF